MGAKALLALVVWIVLSQACFAATVHGNIYDLSLNKVKGAIVESNTTPAQVFIATDGTYTMDIPKGTYLVTAKQKEGRQVLAIENRTISVGQEGAYVIDFILFPVIDEDAFDEIDLSDVAGKEEVSMNTVFAAMVAVLLVSGAAFAYWRYKKGLIDTEKEEAEKPAAKGPQSQSKEDVDYLSQTVAIIRRHGGRATQKDIRKEMPLSEAKISLLIAELEHKGTIEKIKKGRGNIIILK